MFPSTRKRKTWFVEKKSSRDSGTRFLQKRFASSSATINASFLTRLWRQGFNAYGHLNVYHYEPSWVTCGLIQQSFIFIFHHPVRFENCRVAQKALRNAIWGPFVHYPTTQFWELSRCTKSVTVQLSVTLRPKVQYCRAPLHLKVLQITWVVTAQLDHLYSDPRKSYGENFPFPGIDSWQDTIQLIQPAYSFWADVHNVWALQKKRYAPCRENWVSRNVSVLKDGSKMRHFGGTYSRQIVFAKNGCRCSLVIFSLQIRFSVSAC